jgi:hypothetical protein
MKLVSPNRKGQWKEFKEADIKAAKANGWKEKDVKPKKVSKSKESK